MLEPVEVTPLSNDKVGVRQSVQSSMSHCPNYCVRPFIVIVLVGPSGVTKINR